MMQPVSVINLADLIAGVKHERIAAERLSSSESQVDFKHCAGRNAGVGKSKLAGGKSSR